MKFFKKAVSCVLAAVMSLAMLTACGGSSALSGPITYEQSRYAIIDKLFENGGTEEINFYKSDGTYYYSYEFVIADGSKAYFGIDDGEIRLARLHDYENDITYITEFAKNDDAIIASTDKVAFQISSDSIFAKFMISHEDREITSIIAGTATYGGISYYTETITRTYDSGETRTSVYYFSGNTLKYQIEDDGEIWEYVSISTAVDTSKLSIDGYTIITTDDELKAFYKQKNAA